MANTQQHIAPAGLELVDDATLRAFVSSILDYALLVLDPDGYIKSWNPGAEAINGYTAAEVLNTHFSRLYPPESLARGLPEQELQVASQAGRYEDEGWRLRKDGSRYWAKVVISAMRDSRGTLIGFAELTRDLTERRGQDDAVNQSEERFRSLVESVKDYAIFMLDTAGHVTSWNAGAQQIKGYAAEEIIGQHFSRFYPADAIQRGFPDYELRTATVEGRFEDEGWRIRKDGSRFWANVVITAIRDPAGRLTGFAKITRDLTERKAHEEALRTSEARFRLLFDGVIEYAILMLDQQGAVVSWNPGAQIMFGYTPAEAMGKHYSRFFTVEDVAANQPWRQLAKTRRVERTLEEGWRVRNDGRRFWATTATTALHDSQGELDGYASVTQDLTQRHQAEALAHATRRMHEFIAMLAHELRNPLAPIRNAVELMGRKGLGDPLLESMRQTIDRQSRHLTKLLDDLLEVNRIARGQFRIDKLRIDLRDVLARSIETSRPLIDARRHRFSVDFPENPLWVVGDAVRLTQTFVNLLNNAAKYTPEGGDIALSATKVEDNWEISIRDNGRGIAEDQLERIFDLFVQINSDSRDTVGGLGVGLALVRRVVDLHAGHVLARSAGIGQGSEFIVRLPHAGDAPQAANPATAAPHPQLRRLRILVVDDNPDAAASLEALLTAMDQEVRSVSDGRTAVNIAESFEPDVVLLDIGLPYVNGYQIAMRLRARSKTHPLLVAVTGWGQEEDRERTHKAGFDLHFVKPISEHALREVLETASTRIGGEPLTRPPGHAVP